MQKYQHRNPPVPSPSNSPERKLHQPTLRELQLIYNRNVGAYDSDPHSQAQPIHDSWSDLTPQDQKQIADAALDKFEQQKTNLEQAVIATLNRHYRFSDPKPIPSIPTGDS